MEQLNLKLTLNKNGSVTASWSPIAGAIKYTAYMYPLGATYMIYNKTNLTSTSYTSQANLADNTQYDVVVYAYGDGSTLASDKKRILIPLGHYEDRTLSVPENVRATATANSVSVSFDKVQNATNYDILFDGKVYTVSNTTRDFTGLKPKTNHTYAVRAKNASKTTAYSATKSIMTKAQSLAVPYGIQKTAEQNSVTISWSSVSNATGYDIQFDGGTYSVNGTLKVFPGLTADKLYRFRIRSKNADGASAYTPEYTVTTAPKAPTNIRATSTASTVVLEWDKVAGAAGYIIRFDYKNYHVASSTTTKTFSGLQPNTSYYYQMCSKSEDGSGNYSEVKTILTKANAPEGPTAPTAPTNITAKTTEKTVTVSWKPVSGATGYNVLFNGDMYNISGTSWIFTGLQPNTSYKYRVRSNNANGAGEYSEEQTVKTTPKAPVNSSATTNEGTVTISWEPQEGATGYIVSFNNTEYSTSATSKTFTGLSANTSYSYSICTKNANGKSSYSSTKTVKTAPNYPSSPVAEADKYSVTISWNAVSGATSYDVLFDGNTYKTTVTSKLITGLTPGKSYKYSVRSNNSSSSSSYSPEKEIATLPNPPSAPKNVSVSVAANSVIVKWDAVSGATSYDVWFDGEVYNVTTNSKTFTGLEPDTRYQYSVRANNAGGTGTYSDLQSIRTLLTAPTVPANVTATATSNSVRISWSATPRATSYEVWLNNTVYSVTGTSKTIYGLASNILYAYKVCAKNSMGSSGYSASQNVRTKLPLPQKVEAGSTAKTALISFEPVEGATGYEIKVDDKVYEVNEPCLELTDLEPETEYTYSVRAKNPYVESEYSTPKTIITSKIRNRLEYGNAQKSYPNGKKQCLQFDPINALTGAFLWNYTFLKDYGKDNLNFTVMYNSHGNNQSKVLGNKWTYSLNYQLVMNAGYTYFITPYGEVIPFRKSKDNDSFQSVKGSESTYIMVKNADETYSVKELDGSEYIFDNKLCLKQIVEGGIATYCFYSDATGQIIRVEGKYGGNLKFDYTDGHITKVTDALGNTLYFKYGIEQLLSVVDANENMMSFTYDKADNLLTISDFTGNTYLTNKYDAKGRVTEQSTVGRGKCLASYDDVSKVSTFTDELGNVTKYTHNEAEQILLVEMDETNIHCSYNENGQMTEWVDALDNSTKMAYDEYGRLSSVTHPDKTTEQVAYSENNLPIKVVNREGKESLYKYDERNNLIAAQDERGNTSFYEYDANDNLIKLKDKSNNEWTYSYDDKNHLKEAVDPEGNIYQYSHDAIGRLISYKSPMGRTTSYQYSETGDLLRIKDANGDTIFDYNENGSRTGITDKMGNKQRLEYNEMGQVSLATDFQGNEYRFSYDERGNLIAETDPLGYSVKHAYDAKGNQTELTDKNGNTTRFSFNAANQLTEVRDAANGTVSYTYDTMGQVTLVKDPLERQTAYMYDSMGRVIRETNALGDSVSYTYDACGNLLTKTDEDGVVTSYTYDKENRLLTMESEAGTVRFTYDKLGRLAAVEDMDGHIENAAYNSDGELIVSTDKESNKTVYVYDDTGHISEKTEPNGGKVSYSYDKNGNCIRMVDAEGNESSYAYDSNNRLIKVIDPLGHEIVYEYDAGGRMIAVTDARGGKTDFEYDGNGNLIKEINPLGGEKVYVYDCLNRVIEITDEEGHKQGFVYDAVGNMTSYTDANAKQWTCVYDAVNKLKSVTDINGDSLAFDYTKTGKIAKVTDQEGAETNYIYDSMGRLIEMSDAMEHRIYFTYDSMGRVLTQTDANGSVTEYSYSPSGNLLSVKKPENNVITYTYNSLGQVLTATDALGNITAYEYDLLGQVVSIVDAMGGMTTFTYTANGQIATATDANGGVTRYTYDACGNLIQIKDAMGNVVAYEYDAMNNQIKECLIAEEEQSCVTIYQYDKKGRMVKQINPLLDEKTYTYDGNGNIVSIVDEDENETLIRYDLNNRPVQMSYGDGKIAVFRYNKRGELVELQDWISTVAMEYDSIGRLKKVTDREHMSVGYSYDANGNLTRMDYPDGSVVGYTYDKNNRLSEVQDIEGIRTTYKYDVLGNLLSMKNPVGSVSYAYNENRQPVNVTYLVEQGSLSGNLIEDRYTYDKMGRIVGSVRKGSMSEQILSTAYTYDVLGRLLSCKEAGNTESYTYDAAGNRISKSVNDIEKVLYQYNAMNQMTAMSAEGAQYRYAYDRRGNLTQERKNNSLIREYTYDATNHMVLGKNLESGEQTEYYYNALNMCIGNIQTSGIENDSNRKERIYALDYLRRTNNVLITVENNAMLDRMVYGRGYERLNRRTIDSKVFYGSDLQYSPAVAVDEQGTIMQYVKRNAWGERMYSMSEDDDSFTSYTYDAVIGKYFAHARFYDALQGRMLAQDPVKRGLNPYLYCDNDPVNKTDPTGEVPHILVGAVLGGVIGGVGGFLGSTVSQALSGEDFDVKKALGSAANNAIVGAVRGTMISTGVGIGTMLASEFVSGTVGNAVEQKIVKNRVDIGESITSGLINAASGAAFGNSPLRSARDAFFRGGRAGATTAAINNLANALRGNNQGYVGNRTVNAPDRMTAGWQSPFISERDPKTLCGSPSPFEGTLGYRSGYQTGKGAQNRNGFSLGSFVKDTVVGFLTGGLSSVAFYGAGKAVEALQNSVRSVHKSGIISNLDDGLNFSNKALEHMGESGRQVPIQTLQDAIRYGEAMPDPRGSNATMYYTTMYKNGKMYNLEVLYDEVSNTVYHFEYARKAMGNLPAIPK